MLAWLKHPASRPVLLTKVGAVGVEMIPVSCSINRNSRRIFDHDVWALSMRRRLRCIRKEPVDVRVATSLLAFVAVTVSDRTVATARTIRMIPWP